MSPKRRWLEFSLVGLLGVAVQLVSVHILAGWGHISALIATALAIELTLVHNFFWHEQLTWRDRPSRPGERLRRLLVFHLANGGISLGGNLAITAALLHYAVPPVAANFVAICVCAIANFLAADRWVFQQKENGTTRSLERQSFSRFEELSRFEFNHSPTCNGSLRIHVGHTRRM